MKDLGKTKFCLRLQLENLQTSILVYQYAYVQKVLEKFNMDKAYPLRTPMVVRAIEKNTNQFRPRQEGKEVLGAEYPYLSAIGALMYFVNNSRPNIVFVVNCLARHSVAHIMRHWNDIKNILRYLHGTTDLELFYRRNQDSGLIEYADIVYLSDPLNARSQT
jgi:hypothetical protein